MTLSVTIQGDGFDRLEGAIRALGEGKARNVYRRAINEAGRDARVPTQRALAKQTGLKVKVTRKALVVTKASSRNLEYKLTGRGGNISLKYFGARETRKGVSAAPFGQRRIFSGRFIKGGLFGNRKALGMGGHVFMPSGARVWGRSFTKEKSGVVIPNEMIKGATAQTFQATGQSKLAQKLERHLKLMTNGVLS
ncbi:hypothetical protein [Roseinatronobacter sp.]